jgi:hypothetical protein
MSTPAQKSKLALRRLETTPGIDGNWKHAWYSEDLENMDLLDEHDLVACIVFHTLDGNESLVRGLIERRGPVSIEIKKANTDHAEDYLVNGQPYTLDTSKILREPVNGRDYNALFDMIVEFGMKGFIEPGESFPVLLAHLKANGYEDPYSPWAFAGELPELSDGALKQPELALALRDKSLTAVAPAAYQPLLCWASPQMVEQFPEQLIALNPFQEVKGHGTFEQWRARAGTPGNMDVDGIDMGIAIDEEKSKLAEYLIAPMAPLSSRMGFADLKGRVLCETDTDFLLSFDASHCDENNLRKAVTFVDKGYCPIRIMAKQAQDICARDFGYKPVDIPFTQLFVMTMSHNYNALCQLPATKRFAL